MIDDPRKVVSSGPNARMRMIAELAVALAEAPWTLVRDDLSRAYRAGLSDDDVLHVIVLGAYFGYLNRIADAVEVPLDYPVEHTPPKANPTRPRWPVAPDSVVGRPAIDMARRPQTATAFTEWRHYIFYSRDAPVSRRQRTLIARWVATWLGDGGISSPSELTANPLDDALRAVSELVTLAPWRLDDRTFAPLRAAGFNDAALFDVCATAASAGVFSRAEVALAALATVR